MGVFLAVISSIFSAIGWLVIQRLLGSGLNPLAIAGLQAVLIGATTAPIWYASGMNLLQNSGSLWVWVGLLAGTGLLSQAAGFWAAKLSTPLLVSTIGLAQPLWLAVFLLVRGERYSAALYGGMVLVMLGVFLVTQALASRVAA